MGSSEATAPLASCFVASRQEEVSDSDGGHLAAGPSPLVPAQVDTPEVEAPGPPGLAEAAEVASQLRHQGLQSLEVMQNLALTQGEGSLHRVSDGLVTEGWSPDLGGLSGMASCSLPMAPGRALPFRLPVLDPAEEGDTNRQLMSG